MKKRTKEEAIEKDPGGDEKRKTFMLWSYFIFYFFENEWK